MLFYGAARCFRFSGTGEYGPGGAATNNPSEVFMPNDTLKKCCAICGAPTARSDSKYCCRACVAEGQRRALYRHACVLCGDVYSSGNSLAGLCSAACRRETARNAMARTRERMKREQAEALAEMPPPDLPEDHELAEMAWDFLPPASFEAPQRPIDPFLGF